MPNCYYGYMANNDNQDGFFPFIIHLKDNVGRSQSEAVAHNDAVAGGCIVYPPFSNFLVIGSQNMSVMDVDAPEPRYNFRFNAHIQIERPLSNFPIMAFY